MLVGVLLDVGGTLWPDQLPLGPAESDASLSQLGVLLPELATNQVCELLERLRQVAREVDATPEQDSTSLTQRAGEQLGLSLDRTLATAVRRAMAANTAQRKWLFDGVPELLRTIRELGGRCVILSNAVWRGADEYRLDFEALGLAEYVDAFVSSVDVGFRKPHPAMFQAALAAAGCTPETGVMIGNSEINDVLPARAMGMRVLRVAIEEPPPTETAAHAVATSLDEVAVLIRQWWT